MNNKNQKVEMRKLKAEMKSNLQLSSCTRYGLTCLFLACLLITFSFDVKAQIAVRGETIYTMAGAPLKDGVVLINGNKIERVGTAASIQIPANYRTVTAKVVTPGFVDAHTVAGLAGYLNQAQEQDQLERSSPMQPELRAIDAYNPRERLIEYLRSFGVTTLHTGHGPGSLVSGQTMIVKTYGNTADEAVINPNAMVAVTMGESGLGQAGRSPGTRGKMMSMLRDALIKAGEYDAKRKSAKADAPQTMDLRQDVLTRVLRRETPLLITAHRAQDIQSALRLAREFNIKIVLDGASEAYLLTNEIKAANVPVIIHPTMMRFTGETDNASMETASVLKRAGILVALQSGYEGYVPKTRVVLFEAAVAAANGLSMTDALATITIDAARLIGVESRVGSIEAGKDADLALFDGDPFEYTSHVTNVIAGGQLMNGENDDATMK